MKTPSIYLVSLIWLCAALTLSCDRIGLDPDDNFLGVWTNHSKDTIRINEGTTENEIILSLHYGSGISRTYNAIVSEDTLYTEMRYWRNALSRGRYIGALADNKKSFTWGDYSQHREYTYHPGGGGYITGYTDWSEWIAEDFVLYRRVK